MSLVRGLRSRDDRTGRLAAAVVGEMVGSESKGVTEMLRDIRTSAALRHWRKPLEGWFEVLDLYRADAAKDEGFWYNERATLSTLAGALWRANCPALEEYRTTRSGNGPDSTAGRTDLWCKIGSVEYTVEAKQHPKASYPAKPTTIARWAKTQLEWAAAQCSTDDFGGMVRLAMVFMVPSLDRAPTEESLEGWVQEVQAFEADIKAYYLNVPARQSERNKRFFPGVVMLAQVVPPNSEE